MRATCDECRSGREKEGTRLVLNWELPDKMETRRSCIWKGRIEIGQRYWQWWKSIMTKRVKRQRTDWREESRRDQEQVAICYTECALLWNGEQTWVASLLSLSKTLHKPSFYPHSCWQGSSGSPASSSCVLPLSGKVKCSVIQKVLMCWLTPHGDMMSYLKLGFSSPRSELYQKCFLKSRDRLLLLIMTLSLIVGAD